MLVLSALELGVPPDTDYPRISAAESASNPDTDIIFSHPSIFVSDPISECCVLHNDIGMEKTILQWNKVLNFDILSW